MVLVILETCELGHYVRLNYAYYGWKRQVRPVADI